MKIYQNYQENQYLHNSNLRKCTLKKGNKYLKKSAQVTGVRGSVEYADYVNKKTHPAMPCQATHSPAVTPAVWTVS